MFLFLLFIGLMAIIAIINFLLDDLEYRKSIDHTSSGAESGIFVNQGMSKKPNGTYVIERKVIYPPRT